MWVDIECFEIVPINNTISNPISILSAIILKTLPIEVFPKASVRKISGFMSQFLKVFTDLLGIGIHIVFLITFTVFLLRIISRGSLLAYFYFLRSFICIFFLFLFVGQPTIIRHSEIQIFLFYNANVFIVFKF